MEENLTSAVSAGEHPEQNDLYEDAAGGDDGGDAGERVFSQSELNRVVEQRLKRERRRFERELTLLKEDLCVRDGGEESPAAQESPAQEASTEAAAEAAPLPEDESVSERIDSDLLAFSGDYPDVDIEALMTDENFKRFCGGKLLAMPLSQIYEDFRAVVGEARADALRKAVSKKSRSTAACDSAGVGTALSEEQQKLLTDWNRRYPDDAINAKEFTEFFR